MTEPVDTFYERPILDRVAGRYTVTWGAHKIRVRIRLRDQEGFYPSLSSVLDLPKIVLSRWRVRNELLLEKPSPFLPASAVQFLGRLVQQHTRVLEIGGGNSTLWLLSRGGNIDTIEHSSEWAESILEHVENKMPSDLAERLRMHVVCGASALETIRSFPDGYFDVVLVDSMNAYTRRNLCVEAALGKVKNGGWMVLDDSDAPINWAGADLMSSYPCRRFTGYRNMSLYVGQTRFWQL
jgi:hypothetical protein